jgi:hypothetical protein
VAGKKPPPWESAIWPPSGDKKTTFLNCPLDELRHIMAKNNAILMLLF